MKVEFEGIGDLISQLERTANDTKDAKKDALVEGAKVMQKATQQTAPYRTGQLKENVQISDVEQDDIYVYVDQQGKAYYGYFLEYGTSKMTARPFMAPAFNRSRGQIQTAIANSLRKRLGL